MTTVEQLRRYFSGEFRGALGVVSANGREIAEYAELGCRVQHTSNPSTEMPETRLRAAGEEGAIRRRLAGLSRIHADTLRAAYTGDRLARLVNIDLETAAKGGLLRRTQEVAELAAVVASLPETVEAWAASGTDKAIEEWLRALDARMRQPASGPTPAIRVLVETLYGLGSTVLRNALAAFEGTGERHGKGAAHTPRRISVEQAAVMLGMDVRSVRRLCSSGRFAAVKRRGRRNEREWRVNACCVVAYVEARKRREAADAIGARRAVVEEAVEEHACEGRAVA